MKIQRINKYYDFAAAKKLCKRTALRQKQEHYIVSAKTLYFNDRFGWKLTF